MIEIESGSALQMRTSAFGDVLDDINKAHRRLSMMLFLGLLPALGGTALLLLGAALGLLLVLLAIPGLIVGRWVDSHRKVTALFYDVEQDLGQCYERMTAHFDELVANEGKWHVAAAGMVRDLTTWKRNAGASHIVSKSSTSLVYALPKVVKSNITPPSVRVGRQTVYFLPDVALIQDGREFGAVSYSDLRVSWATSNFVEEGRVPRDAQVIGHTWKHPNKSGGPDRRFSQNYQIPICSYEALHLSSPTGLNELLEFSKPGSVGPFADSLQRLAEVAHLR